MSILKCKYCDQYIDIDKNLEHFADNEQEICHKQLDGLDSFKYGKAIYYHNKGELELVEVSEGEFDNDTFGYQLEFREAMREREEDKKNQFKNPEL